MHDINVILSQDENFNFVGVQFRGPDGRPGYADSAPWLRDEDLNKERKRELTQRYTNNNRKTYYYKTFEKFEIGDMAVVDSPVGGLVVTDVVAIDCMLEAGERPCRWLVQKVDMTQYLASMAREKEVNAYLGKIRLNELRNNAFKGLTESLAPGEVNSLISIAKGQKDVTPQNKE